ncbi:hypothetical protein MNBD_NITROSPINAE04-51, partial [hydrothermal vent metagenome]
MGLFAGRRFASHPRKIRTISVESGADSQVLIGAHDLAGG